MKKLFISVPMRGRTKEAIKSSYEFMHKYAELMVGEKLEVIESRIEESSPQGCNDSVWYLGESIKRLSEADVFVGIGWPGKWKRCEIERDIARGYGIPLVLTVDWENAEAFRDCVEITRCYTGCCEVLGA